MHGIDGHNSREAPADTHEHADDDAHARVPDQKDDHAKAKNQEQKSDPSRHRNSETRTLSFRKSCRTVFRAAGKRAAAAR